MNTLGYGLSALFFLFFFWFVGSYTTIYINKVKIMEFIMFEIDSASALYAYRMGLLVIYTLACLLVFKSGWGFFEPYFRFIKLPKKKIDVWKWIKNFFGKGD